MSLISPARVGDCLLPQTADLDGGLRMSLKAEGVQVVFSASMAATEASTMSGAGAVSGVFAAGSLHFAWRGWGAVGLLTVVLRDRSGAEFLSATGSYRARVDRHDGLEPLSAAPGPGEPLPASVAMVATASGRIRAVSQAAWPPYIADRIRGVLQALDPGGSSPEQELHRLRALSQSASRASGAVADVESLTTTWSTSAR